MPALQANPDAVIAGIADPDTENRDRTAQRFEIPPERVFTSAAEMLAQAELDAAIVAVPHSAHADLARAVLDRGLHLLLEKPMTIQPPDARALAALAKSRGVELIIGYPWHYNARSGLGCDRRGPHRHDRICLLPIRLCARALYRGNPAAPRDILDYAVNAPGSGPMPIWIAGGGRGDPGPHSAALLFLLTGPRPVSVAALTESFDQVDLAMPW